MTSPRLHLARHVALALALALPTAAAAQRTPARAAATTPAVDRWALVGGTVITATGEPPIPDAVVVVEGRRITAVGPRASTPLPLGTRVVDAGGQFVTPGLIDVNVHLVLMITPEFYVKYEDRFEDIAVQGAQVALKYGLTTVMDSWGPLAPLQRARQRIASGTDSGARILLAGNIVGTGGPFSLYFSGGYDLRGTDLRYGGWVHPIVRQRIDALWEDDAGPALLALTPEEVGDAITRYLGKGVDFLKVGVSAHGIGPVEPLMFSSRALGAMRDATARAGKPFQTHTFTLESLREAIAVRPQLLQHPNVMSVPPRTAAQLFLLDSLIAEIKRLGIYAAPLAVPHDEQQAVFDRWTIDDTRRDPHLGAIIQQRQLGQTRAAFAERRQQLQRWLGAGLKLVIGTDQGPEASELGPVVWGRMGRRHFEVMEGLQQAGAIPMELVVAATRHGAEAYGLADSLGTIAPGKVADLLVVDADPLADIANLRRIRHVVKDGRVVDRATLPAVRVLQFDPEARWPR